MDEYIKDLLEEEKYDLVGMSVTPSSEHLLEVRKNPTFIDENTHKKFHTMTPKLLLLTKISRPDILKVVAFLTTIVKGSEIMYGYKKLGQVIKYLRGDP